MKLLNVNNVASLQIPDEFTWHLGANKTILIVDTKNGHQVLELELLNDVLKPSSNVKDRYLWCHDWLVEYLRQKIGPPYQSSIEKIKNEGWVGYQAITALEEYLYKGTRCIVGKRFGSALRLSFNIKNNQIDQRILRILESVRFITQKAS